MEHGRLWVETEGEYKQKKRNEIMNLLRKINRHIKLIEKKIKREHSENKASFPEFVWWHAAWGQRLKASHLRAAIEGRLLSPGAKRGSRERSPVTFSLPQVSVKLQLEPNGLGVPVQSFFYHIAPEVMLTSMEHLS